MHNYKNLITEIPDFPKKGVNFKDISPLLASNQFQRAIKEMAHGVDFGKIDYVAGIESRGFILGAALAEHLGKGFLPVRKQKKLPPPVVSISYQLEYGTDILEMKKGHGRVLLVDDVLATGGTLFAAATLCQNAGYEVHDISVLIDLRFLNKFSWNNIKAKAVIHYDH